MQQVVGNLREGNEHLDVPMGCFDGAEMGEFYQLTYYMRTYILSQLNTVFENEMLVFIGTMESGFLEIFHDQK